LTGPNLSEWALKHRSFTIFLMMVVTVAGLTAYFRLGRNEDPAFTFRTMVVQASWPGATLDDTLSQVTERLERKLQEIKGLDFLQLYQPRPHDHLRRSERINETCRRS
jgi:multidrug efflux pump